MNTEIVSFFGLTTKNKVLVVVDSKGTIKLPGVKNGGNLKPQECLNDKFHFKQNHLKLDGLLHEIKDKDAHVKVYLLKETLPVNFSFENRKVIKRGESFEEMPINELKNHRKALPSVTESIKQFLLKTEKESAHENQIDALNKEVFKEKPVPIAVM